MFEHTRCDYSAWLCAVTRSEIPSYRSAYGSWPDTDWGSWQGSYAVVDDGFVLDANVVVADKSARDIPPPAKGRGREVRTPSALCEGSTLKGVGEWERAYLSMMQILHCRRVLGLQVPLSGKDVAEETEPIVEKRVEW